MLSGLSVSEGDLVRDRYRIEKIVGEGGTGVVVLATDLTDTKKVAIKFLRRALNTDELRTRFEREALAIAKVASEHVVAVLDAGTLDDGAPFMVMEHLEGRDLARILKEDGPLPIALAVDCMVQVCDALARAHELGIVHRDLKPANVFLEDRHDGRVHAKIVDFGISKFLDKRVLGSADNNPAEVTNAFTMLGSPRYMAPEQVRNSRDVDSRADLWSVGVVLFQLVTGQHVFNAKTNVEASIAVLTAEPQRLCALEPKAPRGLDEVVRRCLTRDVAARFQTARELATALRPFGSVNR
jgi:serine/threonine-protein kinase